MYIDIIGHGGKNHNRDLQLRGTDIDKRKASNLEAISE